MIVLPVRAGRILIVDNDLDRLDSTQALLETKGYQVFVTSTLAQAARLLSQERIHLVLLDIRLEADSDPTDTSGLDFATKIDPVVAKIILTAYPSYEAIKRALGAAVDVPAVDFVTKQDGPVPLLAAIERAFREKVNLNFDLSIHWQGQLTLAQVAQEIELFSDDPAVVASEVEEILGKLFSTADEIIVSPLISGSQYRLASPSGAVVLKVEPHYGERGQGAPVVVKLASREKAAPEADNYQRFVKDFVGSHRRTNLERFAETHLLGGLIYSLIGTSLEETMDLSRFYTQHEAGEIITVLEHLFGKTCSLWYGNRKPRQLLNLTQAYQQTLRMTIAKIELALQAQQLEEFLAPHWQFPGLGQSLANPLRWLEQQADWVAPLYTCITHGDLHSRNVLIDEGGQVWLIDFYRTGEGHILRDLLELETDIKFTLIEVTDLPTWLEFETALLAPSRLDELLSSPNLDIHPQLQKGFAVIAGLRRIAAAILGAEAELTEYYWGLFLLTLNILRLRNIDRLKKRSALLSAALLAQRLQT